MDRKPNFFIIGAPKCGTTALSQYLGAHPNVFMSTPKEPNHFNTDFFIGNPTVIRPYERYMRLFDTAGPSHTAIGEASVWYLYSKKAILNIREYNPGARLILMLRNPVDMVHSLHSQFVYNQVEPETDFQKAWHLQEMRAEGHDLPKVMEPHFYQYKRIGQLGEQVERLFQTYPREQILTILFDDFGPGTQQLYSKTLDFLELNNDGRTDFPRINPNKGFKYQWLTYFTQKPHPMMTRTLKWGKGLLGIEHVKLRSKLALYNTKSGTKRSPLSPSFREQLHSAFKRDIERLSGLIHRNLEHWYQ